MRHGLLTMALCLGLTLAVAVTAAARRDGDDDSRHHAAGEVQHGSGERSNPLVGNPAAIARGKAIFLEKCAVCHGADAKGKVGPNLTDSTWMHGDSDRDLFENISGGLKDEGMPAWGNILDKESIWSVIAYIRSLKGS